MQEPRRIKELCESLVRSVIKAHKEYLKKDRMVFEGQIMTVSIRDDFESSKLEFTDEFRDFIVEHVTDGTLDTPLNKATIIVLTENWSEPRKKKRKNVKKNISNR